MSRNQSEIAYDYLRQKILNREIKAGSRVRYGPIGKEIGMSATPIREAIGRLATEGLVELVPQSGAIIRIPTREDVIEVYELREAIEPFAAAKATQLMGRKQLKSLKETLDEMKAILAKSKKKKLKVDVNKVAFDQADMKFHATILEAANNRRMLNAVSDSQVLTSVFGTERHNYEVEVLEMTIEDHQAIFEGFKNRDSEDVRKAMLAHIINSRQLTLSFLNEQPQHFN